MYGRARKHTARSGVYRVSVLTTPRELPTLKLNHLSRMTDSTGVFQHAIFSVPNFSEGYCTDDNARAFILAVLLDEMEEEPESVRMAFLIVLERIPWGTPTILERARREAFGGAAYTDMVVRLRLRQAFGLHEPGALHRIEVQRKLFRCVREADQLDYEPTRIHHRAHRPDRVRA